MRLFVLGAIFFLTSVNYMQAEWITPIPIPNSQNSFPSNIGLVKVDKAGNAVTVWNELQGSTFSVLASTKPFSGSWTNAVTLSDSSLNSFLPQIAIQSNGDAIAIWGAINQNGGNLIQASRYDAKKMKWTRTQDIPIDPNFQVFFPSVAINDEGDALAVWTLFGNTTALTQGATLSSESQQFKHVTTLSSSNDFSEFASVTIDSKGNGVVTWSEATPSGSSLTNTALWRVKPHKPKFFHGSVEKNGKKFDLQTRWKAPNHASDITYYKIYEDGKEIKTIKASHDHKFHTRVPSRHNLDKRYEIRSYSTNGTTSHATKLKIKR
jgi:hypothetical protein